MNIQEFRYHRSKIYNKLGKVNSPFISLLAGVMVFDNSADILKKIKDIGQYTQIKDVEKFICSNFKADSWRQSLVYDFITQLDYELSDSTSLIDNLLSESGIFNHQQLEELIKAMSLYGLRTEDEIILFLDNKTDQKISDRLQEFRARKQLSCQQLYGSNQEVRFEVDRLRSLLKHSSSSSEVKKSHHERTLG